ncbi:MAG: chromosome segregation protein SMC, partial [Betaproteobacteria bacterium]
GRLAQQAAQINEQIAAIATQIAATDENTRSGERELEAAIARREAAEDEQRVAAQAMTPLESRIAEVASAVAAVQQRISDVEQAIRVAETRRENADKALNALAQRRERLEAEERDLASRPSREIAIVGEQLEQESVDLAEREKALNELNDVVHSLQERHRVESDAWQSASSALAEREARAQALAALQAKIGGGPNAAAWSAAHGVERARRLWQQLDIEPGWEDALEAVLRERLNAIEVSSLDSAAAWTQGNVALPGRVAAYAATTQEGRSEPGGDTLLAKVKTQGVDLSRVLADWLSGVRCVADLDAALVERRSLSEGEALVTPAGHVVSAQAVSLFAPDSELHGVLVRQRELHELESGIARAREQTLAAEEARTSAETELKARQQQYHDESLALSSQQRRCHELELELLQLKQAAEAAEHRRAQIAQELAAVSQEETAERDMLSQIEAEVAGARGRLSAEAEQLASARDAASEADAALTSGREHVRKTELSAQEAGFAERACRERLAEFARRREALQAQAAQQQNVLDQLTGERGQIDREPVEAALQAQLAVRAAAEEALAGARDRQELMANDMRSADEARLAASQKLDPARAKIDEIRLKEQAALLAEQQYAEQLSEAHADLTALPAQMKAWGRASGLPAEIERLTQTITALGPVNLAALDELAQTSERKAYLDAQAQDLTEAMATLETAIRQIDRESRQLLQETFDAVNVNFGSLFPTLFGGGQAKLLLTGEEILDSGVQVIAQPPGKRNTSIHLLSGGEKSLTAISLVFALFQLNPAPFCLLDEVDAPLDDPNTERFCALVRTMTEATQFVFISHNKITMEMASQLIGITMPDPGVSRVVAVDIAEALELAETAA